MISDIAIWGSVKKCHRCNNLIEIRSNRLIIYWLNELHFFFAIKPILNQAQKEKKNLIICLERHKAYFLEFVTLVVCVLCVIYL